MKIIPFKKAHLDKMIVQEHQKGYVFLETSEMFDQLAGEDSFSAIDDDGTVWGCAGLVRITQTRGVAWAYLAQDMNARMITVTRAIKRYFEMSDLIRIEMQVDCEFPQGHRWAKMLGFEKECERMRAFTPDLRDCALYAKVRV